MCVYTGITGYSFSEFVGVFESSKAIFSAMSQVGKISFFDIAVSKIGHFNNFIL